jgi:Tol biopolymer transport system component
MGTPGAHPNFNTTFADGCPSVSRDGKTFFMASNRPGSQGLDIWLARRASTDQPWGEPVNMGAPVNSASNDFCPMASRDGREFYFVSNRPGGCGGDDIYVTRFRDDGSVEDPKNLGCTVNSAGNEAGPVPITEPRGRTLLYFSSTRPGGPNPEADGATSGDADLYVSEMTGGSYAAPTLVAGVNSAQEDGQPYIQRDGLELYFFSTRPGGFGAQDIWRATRASVTRPWSEPVNLGEGINTAAGETRPSMSWDGTTLFFGSTRSTSESNIFTSERTSAAAPR